VLTLADPEPPKLTECDVNCLGLLGLSPEPLSAAVIRRQLERQARKLDEQARGRGSWPRCRPPTGDESGRREGGSASPRRHV